MPERPAGVEADVDLARLTTVRTGGAARWFAQPESVEQLAELLGWAESEGLPVGIVGSGSNLLISDRGFGGLALKLGGELTGIERVGANEGEADRGGDGDGDFEAVICGGGMRLPSAAAKTAGWGLEGLEFGVNIPGTVGGAVKMNANAYGGELAAVLEWVEVCGPGGTERRGPEELGFGYRHSNLGAGEVVARAGFRLRPADPDAVRTRMQEMRGWRREAQPTGIKTFGSTFKNPAPEESGGRSAGQLLEAAGCRGLEVGNARFSPDHANFVENPGSATTADVLAVMAEGRRRVRERFGILLEPEVQVLGPVEWPPGWDEAGA